MKMTTFAVGALVALLIVGVCTAFGGFADLNHLAHEAPRFADTAMAMSMVLPGLPKPKPRGIVAVRAEGPADVRAAIEAVNRAFETFKETHAEKEKEINKRFDDVVTSEKFDRVNSAVGDLQKTIDDINAKIAAAQLGVGGEGKVNRPGFAGDRLV